MKESIIFSEHNLTEKVHYVYRVTIDGKYYIGKRTGFLNDLIIGRYRTSSKIVIEKLKNGKHFSKIKIIQIFSSPKDALEFESRILTRVDAKRNPKFLNQSNGNGKNFYNKQHTEETKEKISKSHKERFNPNTPKGRKNKEKRSQSTKAQFDINTESGRRNRKNHSEIKIEFFKTERGIKTKENHSDKMKEYFNPETERGRKNLENHSKSQRNRWDENTELGLKRRENQSNKRKEYFNPETENGRKNLENHSNKRKEEAKERTQKRIDASILGDLMFNEEFIKENFLITDDKNNLRFLSPVYSKLSGYCMSHICEEKRIGKLRFLYGIKSIIKISEEFENSKIEEIKAIIKSRNEKEEAI